MTIASTHRGGRGIHPVFVRAKECANQIQRRFIVKPFYYPQDLQFIVERQTVAALGFNGGRTMAEKQSTRFSPISYNSSPLAALVFLTVERIPPHVRQFHDRLRRRFAARIRFLWYLQNRVSM